MLALYGLLDLISWTQAFTSNEACLADQARCRLMHVGVYARRHGGRMARAKMVWA